MKSVVAITVALGLTIAFTSPTLAASNKAAELYNAASSKTELTLFGHEYKANYAPLTSADDKLTGALFVGVPK